MYCLVTCKKISISISFERDSELLLNEIQLIVTGGSYLRGLWLFYANFR